MILGLDVSTTTTGWCLYTEDGRLQSMGFIDQSRSRHIVDKAKCVEDFLSDVKEKFSISHCFIEAPLQRFSRGMSSAATINKLASYNGIIQFVVYRTLGVYPELLNVNQARKSIGLKVLSKKKCGIDTKQQVLDWVSSEEPSLDWPTKILSSGPRKGVTINIPQCFDMADAYVIARAGFVHLRSDIV